MRCIVLCIDTDTLAPPIKQKARFKIKDAKCHLRPRNRDRSRDSSRHSQQGIDLSVCLFALLLTCSLQAGSNSPFVLIRFVLRLRIISQYSLLLGYRCSPYTLHPKLLPHLPPTSLLGLLTCGPSLSACPVPRGFEGVQFPCTDDCQVTFVNLKCDSSKKRRRGRKSPTKEVSHITAEFEMEMKEKETSGVFLFLDGKNRSDG